MNDLGQFQNSINELPSLDISKYEDIFKIYTVEKTPTNYYYFYNILKKVELPPVIDQSFINKIGLNRDLPWTTLSYGLYGTQHLWWLIVLLNKPDNIFIAEAGTTIRYFLPQVVPQILDSIRTQKNK